MKAKEPLLLCVTRGYSRLGVGQIELIRLATTKKRIYHVPVEVKLYLEFSPTIINFKLSLMHDFFSFFTSLFVVLKEKKEFFHHK